MTAARGRADSAVLAVADRSGAAARRRAVGIFLALCAIVAACIASDVFAFERYRDAVPTFLQLLGDSFPPDFSRWQSWGQPFAETVTMSIAGTALAAVIALPLAFLAARNTAPLPALVAPVRAAMSILRTVPDILMAALLVAVLGFGTLPGVIALTLHSLGMLGKFYAEIIEHVDPAPGDAILSQGGSKLQAAWFAIIPEIVPRVADITLYRWEHNLRSAMMMGLVGAGGLGLELVTALKLFEYREAAALFLLTAALVVLIDGFGGWLRARFIGNAPQSGRWRAFVSLLGRSRRRVRRCRPRT